MKPSVAFITTIKRDDSIYWEDGLFAAINILREKYDLSVLFAEDELDIKPDVLVVWGGTLSPQVLKYSRYKGKKVCLYAGGPFESGDDVADLSLYDHVCVEDKWAQREAKKHGIESTIAFGTNTKIFRPLGLSKTIDVLFVGAFASWKRLDKFVAYSKGKKALAVGFIQENDSDSKNTWRYCLEHGITVIPPVLPRDLAFIYNQAMETFLPHEIVGGGQRVVLESLACGTPVTIRNDRLKELAKGEIPNESDYARSLNEVVRKLL